MVEAFWSNVSIHVVSLRATRAVGGVVMLGLVAFACAIATMKYAHAATKSAIHREILK